MNSESPNKVNYSNNMRRMTFKKVNKNNKQSYIQELYDSKYKTFNPSTHKNNSSIEYSF